MITSMDFLISPQAYQIYLLTKYFITRVNFFTQKLPFTTRRGRIRFSPQSGHGGETLRDPFKRVCCRECVWGGGGGHSLQLSPVPSNHCGTPTRAGLSPGCPPAPESRWAISVCSKTPSLGNFCPVAPRLVQDFLRALESEVPEVVINPWRCLITNKIEALLNLTLHSLFSSDLQK